MAHATVDSLILDLLEWVSRRERTYEEVIRCLANLVSQVTSVGGGE